MAGDTGMSSERAGDIRASIRQKYAAVAEQPRGKFPYAVGRESVLQLGYAAEWTDSIPDEVLERFVGVGNPFSLWQPNPGDSVLDVGCGAGWDSFAASLGVGVLGRVAGVDVTPEILAIARHARGQWHLRNLDFAAGSVEALPYASESFDAVISNGVLNLSVDKDASFAELARVLRNGGTFVAADLLVDETIPEEVLAAQDAWSG